MEQMRWGLANTESEEHHWVHIETLVILMMTKVMALMSFVRLVGYSLNKAGSWDVVTRGVDAGTYYTLCSPSRTDRTGNSDFVVAVAVVAAAGMVDF